MLDRSIVNQQPLKAVRAAIALTPDQAAYLRQMISDVVVIPSGVDPEAFSPPSAPLKDPQLLRFAVVGSYMRDFAALERVAAATTQRKDIEFAILGPAEQTQRFRHYPHCRVLPRLPYPDYLRLLQSSDALFLPLQEGAANTAVLEAMACGIAVVTNAGEGPGYYVGDGGWLYGSTEEVMELLKDASFKQQCGARGDRARRRVLEKLSWDKIVPQVVELYRRLG
jgi:glycosyltransferase involved in cell wall biosynthesis